MPLPRKLHCIAALDLKGGIGKNNDLPWKLPKEYQHFVKVTTSVSDSSKQNAVIMGRKTYLSIPPKFRPLKNRLNVVLSTTFTKSDLPENVLLLRDLDSAVALMSNEPYINSIENLFVIGGAGVYKESMNSKSCGRLYITKINGDFMCDTFFPEIDENIFKKINVPFITNDVQVENGMEYQFFVYSMEDNEE